MKANQTKKDNRIRKLPRVAAVVYRKLLGAYAGAKSKERRRLPLVSAFLLLMIAVTIIGAFILKPSHLETYYVMLCAAASFVVLYFVSRTRYYRRALQLAVFIAAIPPIITAIYRPSGANLMMEFMWLALPLCVASLILTMRQVFVLTLTYVVIVIIFGSLGTFDFNSTATLVTYLIAISFFVFAIVNTSAKDRAEIEVRLKERREAEEALRESEERFRRIFQQGPIGIMVSDLNFHIRNVNDKFCKMLGYTEEELRSMTFRDYSFPEDIKADEAQLKKLVKSKITHYNREKRIIRKNKEVIWESLTVTVMRDKNGKPLGLLSMIEDITKRKHAEEALRTSEERFHTIVGHSNDGIVFIQDGNLQYCNPKQMELIGYTEAEVIGQPFINYVVPEERKKVMEIYLKRMAGQPVPDKYELKLLRKNGSVISTEISASLVKIGQETVDMVVVRDITERKEAEEELAKEATRRRILIEQSSDGIVVLDENGGVYEANQRFAEMLGYTLEEVRKLKVYDWEYLASPEQLQQMINTIDEKGDHFETKHKRKDGTTYDVEISTNGAMIAGKKLIFCVCRDITERKQMEESLRESEEKFSKAFISSPQGVMIAGIDDGLIMEVNDAFVELTGYSRKELIGKKTTDLHFWNSRKERDRIIKILNETGAVKNLERHIIDKNGKPKTRLFSADKINIDNKPCMISVTIDITERKQMEEQLRFSDIILESIREGIFAMDTNFKITRWNKICEQMFGIKASKAIGQPVAKLLTMVEEYAGQNNDRINDLLKKGGWKNEQIFWTSEGNKWAEVHVQAIEENGKRTGWVTLLSDISERKEAEAARRQSEEKYHELIDTSTDAIISTDSNMLITIWNNGATNLFGYNEREMLGQSILIIFPADLYKTMAREITFVKKNSKNEFENKILETTGLKKDCSAVPIEVSLSSRRADNGLIVTAIIRDITERKEAEEKLKAIDQMKQEFLSNVSHELRTPLQSISGFTKLIMTGKVPDQATQQEFFQIIDSETAHLGNLINSLLDISRLEAGKFKIYRKATPIAEVFIDSIKMFHSLAREKNIALTENISKKLPILEVDGERLRQVVINLLSNAIKFSDPGSSVQVKAGIHNNEVLFQVIDHGIGIKKEDVKHLFERFYRVEGEKAQGGTGLGLYISKQIIDAHRGKIWVQSKFGEGSTFSFSLPLENQGGKNNGKKNTGNRRRSGDVKAGRLHS